MNKLIAFIDLFRKGSMVADAVRAKQMSAIVGALGVFLYAAAEVAKEYGYDLGVSPEIAQHVAMFIGAVAGVFCTFATSDKVGILPAKPDVPAVREADREAP